MHNLGIVAFSSFYRKSILTNFQDLSKRSILGVKPPKNCIFIKIVIIIIAHIFQDLGAKLLFPGFSH